MDDPAHDQRESLSQPKEFSRTPTWAITDWDEPESKAATAPPKFSIRDFRALANIGLAICLLVSAFVLFGDAVDSPFQRGHRTGIPSPWPGHRPGSLPHPPSRTMPETVLQLLAAMASITS